MRARIEAGHTMAGTISANAKEGRLLVWSPDAEVEQAVITPHL